MYIIRKQLLKFTTGARFLMCWSRRPGKVDVPGLIGGKPT